MVRNSAVTRTQSTTAGFDSDKSHKRGEKENNQEERHTTSGNLEKSKGSSLVCSEQEWFSLLHEEFACCGLLSLFNEQIPTNCQGSLGPDFQH